jgi:PAS domain S-box-containing protein
VVLFSFAVAGIFGLLFGLFTRSQLRAVALAFRQSLDDADRRAHELQESRQWLQTTLNSIGDAVITCDAHGNIDFMNPVAEQLCACKLDDFKGKPLTTAFNIVNEYTRTLVENPVDKVRRLNQVVGLANHTILIGQDGTEYNIDDSGAPIRLESGEIAGIVLVFRDITEQRKTQEAVIANEKLALAGRLAATIAHEIHNPLDSVSNLLYLLAEHPGPQEATNYLALARQELGRVTQISRTMLSLYRESSSPVPVDLLDLLEGALLMLDPKLRALNVQVLTNLEDVIVEGFASELRQVFANLIANAAEAADTGGTIIVELSPVAPREDPALPIGGARVEISDNGPGISEETLGKLFRPFFTTKAEKGTGLGLWISRGIVEKHNGVIQVKSTTRPEDHGSTFVVLLPARVIPVAPMLEPPLHSST